MPKLIHTDNGWQVQGYSALYPTREAARLAAKLPAEAIDDEADLGILTIEETEAEIKRIEDAKAIEDGKAIVDAAINHTPTPEPTVTRTDSANGGNGYQHRETWLHALADKLAHGLFEPAFEVPTNIRYSCGFPSQRAMLPVSGERAKVRIGECWGDDASDDKTFEIFISPLLSDPIAVAGTLAHEMCHAVAGIKAKHGSAFKRVATAVLLEGKMTQCTGGAEFAERVQPWLDDVGPYPMATLNARKMSNGTKKQTTRMIKCECPMCQYTARVASKWLKEVGAPHCPDHGAMEYELNDESQDQD